MFQSAKVVAENLLVQIPEKVERFHAYVGAFDSTLQKTPKVFESVGVNLPINIPFGMVDALTKSQKTASLTPFRVHT